MNLGYSKYYPWGGETNFKEEVLSGEKLHTIRKDEKGRWKPGPVINHLTGNRTPERNEFLTNTCISTQKIVIVFDERGNIDFVTVGDNNIPMWNLIAKNDGLSILDFEKWFYTNSDNGVYSGVIIHWTNLLY
jgi:hypothetical protein